MSRLSRSAARGAALALLIVLVPAATADAPSAACQRMFEWIGTEKIQFRQSSAVLRGSSYPVLERLAEFAYDCPDTRIRITGHTDAVGGAEFNQYLSEQRAQAVADYLASRGIRRERLVVIGQGASNPVADNGTAFGRERNRRIELELLALE